MNADKQKQAVAEAALEYIQLGDIVGVGTGSTANHFIDLLAGIKNKIDGTVASSEASAERLKSHGISVLDINQVGTMPLYVDGADEATRNLHLVKGGGGALTREKIVAQACEKFICIADAGKLVDRLGAFPLPIEVIPMARSQVSRAMVNLGGQPELRAGFTTDNSNIILRYFRTAGGGHFAFGIGYRCGKTGLTRRPGFSASPPWSPVAGINTIRRIY